VFPQSLFYPHVRLEHYTPEFQPGMCSFLSIPIALQVGKLRLKSMEEFRVCKYFGMDGDLFVGKYDADAKENVAPNGHWDPLPNWC